MYKRQIREWFSEGENITTIETTEKVDLKKVRIRKKKKKQKQKEPKKKVKKAVKKPKRTRSAAETTAVIEEEPKPTEEQIVEEPEEREPEPILPAGPILEKPEPARLSGPQVIRVEAPEPLRRPPKPKPKARYDMPVTEPLMYDKQEQSTLAPSKEKKGPPRRSKERTHGRRQEEQPVETAKKPKLIRKWRQRDIEERQARLDAARGEGLRSRPLRKIATKTEREVAASVRPKKVVVSEPITVKDLSAALAIKSAGIIGKLMQQGVMVTVNQAISSDVAELVALELGTELVVERKSKLQEQIRAEFEKRPRKNLKKRSVVATMLGLSLIHI